MSSAITFKMDPGCIHTTPRLTLKACRDPYYLCKHLTKRNRTSLSACHLLICAQHHAVCIDCKESICSFCRLQCSKCKGYTCTKIATCSFCNTLFCNFCATTWQTCSNCKDIVCDTCQTKTAHKRICDCVVSIREKEVEEQPQKKRKTISVPEPGAVIIIEDS